MPIAIANNSALDNIKASVFCVTYDCIHIVLFNGMYRIGKQLTQLSYCCTKSAVESDCPKSNSPEKGTFGDVNNPIEIPNLVNLNFNRDKNTRPF